MQRVFSFSFLLSVFFLHSCAPYQIKTNDLPIGYPSKSISEKEENFRQKARSHYLYQLIPRHRSQIQWYDASHWISWGLVGNDDDGIFGEEPSSNYKTQHPIGMKRALLWSLRNPLHNFSFYVIGSAQWKNSEFIFLRLSPEKFSMFRYRPIGGKEFGGKGSSLLFCLHGWKPFFSLRLYYGRLLEFYLGWRSRGNFGIKFLPIRKAPQPKTVEIDEKNKQNYFPRKQTQKIRRKKKNTQLNGPTIIPL